MSHAGETAFRFLDPGRPTDGAIELVLFRRSPAHPARRYVPSYRFHIRRVADRVDMGGISLRVGDTPHVRRYAGHIGYTVNPPYRGHRYAAKATRLLFPFARQHGMRTLWITANPDNLASRRSIERVGGVYVETVALPPDTEMYRDGERYKCRYRVDL